MANFTVLIVGAGPVGLTLALGLHQGGIPASQILVADQRLSGNDDNTANKALSISASSLEIFRTLGIAEPFISAGIPISKAHFGGGRRLLDLNYEVLGTKYPFNFSIPQWKTEEILLRRCKEVGIVFSWGRRFVELETQSMENEVVAVFDNLHDPDVAARERIPVPWLIGCDSTRSAVRPAACIKWEGTKATRYAWGVECTVDLDAPRLLTGSDSGGSAMMVAVGPGRSRFGGSYPPSEVPEDRRPSPPDEQYVRAWAMRNFKQAFGLHGITWTVAIGDGMYIADTFRSGRVFVAGDAAHQLFPAGGQGMNTGLLDATNLAWKLALVVTNRIVDEAVVERVLDTYTLERKPAVEAVIKNVRVQSTILFSHTEHDRAVADMIAEAFDQPAFNQMYARRVTGFGDPTAPYRSGAHGAQTTDELVGTRLTHISDAHESALLQAARENTFVLASVRAHGVGSAEVFQLAAKYQGRCMILKTALEPTGKQWAGVQAVIIRPDLRVAWALREGSGAIPSIDDLLNTLSWWLGAPLSDPQTS